MLSFDGNTGNSGMNYKGCDVDGDICDWRMSAVFSLKFCIFIKQS